MTTNKLRSYLIGGLIGVLVGAGIGALIVRKWSPANPPLDPSLTYKIVPDALTNEPGYIKVSSSTVSPEPGILTRATRLQSDFVVKAGSPNVRSTLSRGTGGACYIADFSFAKLPRKKSGEYYGTCAEDSDCSSCPQGNFPCNENLESLPKDWFGYCVKENPDDHDGKCWLRPGPPTQKDAFEQPIKDASGEPLDAFCRRSVDHKGKVWPLGMQQDLPYINADVGYGLDRQKIKWRVMACLNVFNPETLKDDSGCPIKRYGPIFQLPQPPSDIGHPESVPIPQPPSGIGHPGSVPIPHE